MRRLFWVGLGIILLTVVGLLAYGWRVRQPIPSPVAGVSNEDITAMGALAPATELAEQWQVDARLAVVSAHWLAVGTQLGSKTEWNLQFFSPATRRLLLVAVADGTARTVRESPVPYDVPTFSTREWRVDSGQALQGWWNQGGGSLVARRPDADLAMQLRAPRDGDGRPVWTVVGSVAGTETALVVMMDARNGTLVEQ